MFEKCQYAQTASLFPPYCVDFPCNPQRIAASNRLVWRKNPSLLGIFPIFKQGLAEQLHRSPAENRTLQQNDDSCIKLPLREGGLVPKMVMERLSADLAGTTDCSMMLLQKRFLLSRPCGTIYAQMYNFTGRDNRRYLLKWGQTEWTK